MPLPLALGAVVAGGSLMKGSYDIAKALENRRYLDDYVRNTRVRGIRYPYRRGYYDYMRAVGSTAQGVGSYGLVRYATRSYGAGKYRGWNDGYDVGFRYGYWNGRRR